MFLIFRLRNIYHKCKQYRESSLQTYMKCQSWAPIWNDHDIKKNFYHDVTFSFAIVWCVHTVYNLLRESSWYRDFNEESTHTFKICLVKIDCVVQNVFKFWLFKAWETDPRFFLSHFESSLIFVQHDFVFALWCYTIT